MPKPVKVPKEKKTVKMQVDESVPQPQVTFGQSEPIAIPKPRKSRAKPKPTKEEMMKLLSDSSNELKQIIKELKEDEVQLLASGLAFKRVSELMKETISNLEEDVQEIDEQLEELATMGDCQEPTE